jgi:hypothetical protein
MPKVFLLPALVASLILASGAYSYFRESEDVDACLDAQHGSFDYQKMVCDLNENHPYVLYETRHPGEKFKGVMAFVVVLASFGSYVLARKSRRYS